MTILDIAKVQETKWPLTVNGGTHCRLLFEENHKRKQQLVWGGVLQYQTRNVLKTFWLYEHFRFCNYLDSIQELSTTVWSKQTAVETLLPVRRNERWRHHDAMTTDDSEILIAAVSYSQGHVLSRVTGKGKECTLVNIPFINPFLCFGPVKLSGAALRQSEHSRPSPPRVQSLSLQFVARAVVWCVTLYVGGSNGNI